MFCRPHEDVLPVVHERSVIPTEVYYQVYDNRMKNDTVFTKADREIQEFVQTKKFRSVLVLVFTWHKVSHYLTRGDARKVTTLSCNLFAGLLDHVMLHEMASCVSYIELGIKQMNDRNLASCKQRTRNCAMVLHHLIVCKGNRVHRVVIHQETFAHCPVKNRKIAFNTFTRIFILPSRTERQRAKPSIQ